MLTRQGKPVAVLLSIQEYEQLSRKYTGFWSAVSEFRRKIDMMKELRSLIGISKGFETFLPEEKWNLSDEISPCGIKKIRGNAMDVQEIIKALSKTREPRAIIYLNKQGVERFFTQRVSAIREFVKSEELSGKLSAGVFSFLKSEVGGQNSTGQKVELDSLLQAMLIEEVEKDAGHLLDIGNEEPRTGSLIYYLGDLHIAVEKEDIGRDLEEGISSALVNVVQEEASRQDKVIKKKILNWKSLLSMEIWKDMVLPQSLQASGSTMAHLHPMDSRQLECSGD